MLAASVSENRTADQEEAAGKEEGSGWGLSTFNGIVEAHGAGFRLKVTA